MIPSKKVSFDRFEHRLVR